MDLLTGCGASRWWMTRVPCWRVTCPCRPARQVGWSRTDELSPPASSSNSTSKCSNTWTAQRYAHFGLGSESFHLSFELNLRLVPVFCWFVNGECCTQDICSTTAGQIDSCSRCKARVRRCFSVLLGGVLDSPIQTKATILQKCDPSDPNEVSECVCDIQERCESGNPVL